MSKYELNVDIEVWDDEEPDNLVFEQGLSRFIDAETDQELCQELREAIQNFCINHLRAIEVHRVYSTRYDCFIGPEGVRQAA